MSNDAVIDFNVDDTASDLEAFLKALAPIFRVHRREPWDIDLTACRYLGPYGAAVLAALFADNQRHGLSAGVFLPAEPPKLRAFCEFSGLQHLIHGDQPADPDHPDSETVPLEFVKKTTWNAPDAVLRLVARHISLSPDADDTLRTAIRETLQNVEDHARSAIGGVICARFIASRKVIRVGVVDMGVGITATLRPRFKDITSDTAALRAVLAGHHSAKSTVRNMGLGISDMSRAIPSSGGFFTALTGSALVTLGPTGGHPAERALPVPFPGTAVFFSLPTAEADTAAP